MKSQNSYNRKRGSNKNNDVKASKFMRETLQIVFEEGINFCIVCVLHDKNPPVDISDIFYDMYF